MPDLDPLLKAKSVAIVGASPKTDSFGNFALRQLLDFNYPGAVWPVNPGYGEIKGLRCFPSVRALPDLPDCAAICVADPRLETALSEVAEVGIPAAVIFGAAAGLASTGEQLTTRLASIARRGGVAMMGANCMGFFNFTDRLFMTGYPYHRPPEPGSIAFITHSGSTLSAVAKNTRGMKFNYVISPGQELVLTAADYLDFVVRQPETLVVGLFLETIRDPAGFRRALEVAERRDIPVVLLKVGRSERGAAMARAHTGALAGDQATIEAVASRHNLILVRSMEEMLDTLELFSAGRRPAVSGLASVHDSGGERGMVVDLAADLNLPFADLVPETMGVLEQTLDPGLEPGNPADLWGSGHDWQRIYRTCIGAMLQDPAVGAFNFGIDFNIGSRLGPDYRAIAIDAFNGTDKPFAVTTNVSAGMDPAEAGDLRAAGVPVLLGTETGLRAFGHLIRHAERARFDRSMPKPVPGLAEALHENRSLDDREVIGEFESLAILRSAGLPAIEAVRITSPADLQPAAKAVGFPLVLKTAVEGILHKSDVDGVVTGIATPESLEEAYSSLAQRLGPDAVVQPQADLTRGIEFFLGATRDPQFGPLVTVGLGGVLIEIMRDAVSFLAPVGPAEVRYRLPELRGAAIFRGARGRAPVDLDALARLVSRFSHFVAAIGDEFAEIDANPVLACGEEFLVLDALIVLARAE